MTNIAQQVTTKIYDASGQKLIVANAFGEKTVTIFDALGRAISSAVYSPAGALVRTNATAYAPNHHSYTTTAGSGAFGFILAIEAKSRSCLACAPKRPPASIASSEPWRRKSAAAPTATRCTYRTTAASGPL